MALTPEDVVNKRFQTTKFRDGYDQDEVDDFLDEIVVELRRLAQENEDLRQRLAQASAQENRTPAPAAVPAAMPAPAYVEPVIQQPIAQPLAPQEPKQAAYDADESTTNLLALARRLHEQHVREGVDKRDALIAEGHATAARLVAEAESKQRQQIGLLEQERVALQKRVDDLRGFERDYRLKLKSYIEGQLRELDTTVSQVASPVAPAPSFAPAPGQVLPSELSPSGVGGGGYPATPQRVDPVAPTYQGFVG